MKKCLVLYVLISFIHLCFTPVCFALDKENILFSAEKVDSESVTGEIHSRVLKKYIPIKLIIENKADNPLLLTKKLYVLSNNKEYRVHNTAEIFRNTRLHTIRRAISWGIPATILTFGILAIPAIGGSIAHSVTTNGYIEENIKKINYKSRTLYEKDYYVSYIFIPKNMKGISEVIIKDVSYEDQEPFDIKANIEDGNL